MNNLIGGILTFVCGMGYLLFLLLLLFSIKQDLDLIERQLKQIEQQNIVINDKCKDIAERLSAHERYHILEMGEK